MNECVCVCFLGDALESGRMRMAKRVENRFWEAFCPLHMHTITQAAMQARP